MNKLAITIAVIILTVSTGSFMIGRSMGFSKGIHANDAVVDIGKFDDTSVSMAVNKDDKVLIVLEREGYKMRLKITYEGRDRNFREIIYFPAVASTMLGQELFRIGGYIKEQGK